jgi:endoglucanase
VKNIKLIELNSSTIREIPQTFHCGYYDASDENVTTINFSQFSQPGIYKCIAGSDTSDAFVISDSVYLNALKVLTRSFYYQRCSFALDSSYAAQWTRKAGHPDTSLSVLEVIQTSLTTKSVQGGWYDAGDYGKYVVCAGITCGTMLGSYELNSGILEDGSLNIPESQNGKDDLLDEIKYELDWLIRMQDDDGGVFFKVGPTTWPGDVLPALDKTRRYIIGKSTSSTLNFAAVMAMAGRIYLKYDSTFANDCKTRAERAWDWAKLNPAITNPTNVAGTGPYDDGNDKKFSDEFLWAASELFITTGKESYKDTLFKMIANKKITSYAWWQDVKNLGFFSLSVHNEMLPDSIKSLVTGSIINKSNALVNDINNCAYRIPLKSGNYLWGSNATIGNMAVILAYAYNIDRNPTYFEKILYTTDYLFGRNPTGYSYVTGLGNNSVRYPHHRPSTGDGIKEPVPGLVVGGPNKNSDGADQLLTDIIEAGTAPAKCYIDDNGSWASNEISINQNAPWILILSFLEKNAKDIKLSRATMNLRKNQENHCIKYSRMTKCIRIDLPVNGKNMDVSIYNINGKCLLKKSATNQNAFHVGNFSSPIIVRIKSESFTNCQLLQTIN